jgi:hypothetical protein
MDITIAQDKGVTLLRDWIVFYKIFGRLINVLADGMCGWFCLAVCAQYFNDCPFFRLDDGSGWKPSAWEEMFDMLKAVVDEVLKACKTLSRKSDIQAPKLGKSDRFADKIR